MHVVNSSFVSPHFGECHRNSPEWTRQCHSRGNSGTPTTNNASEDAFPIMGVFLQLLARYAAPNVWTQTALGRKTTCRNVTASKGSPRSRILTLSGARTTLATALQNKKFLAWCQQACLRVCQKRARRRISCLWVTWRQQTSAQGWRSTTWLRAKSGLKARLSPQGGSCRAAGGFGFGFVL